MSWVDVGQIAVACIASAGGIGAIIIGVVKFSVNRIADRMNAKFEATLSKELEKYKTELSKKEYVSKTRFDAEFGIYRELSKAFFNMARDINSLIPAGYSERPANEDDYRKCQEECWHASSQSLRTAQETLVQNAPFISEELYNDFLELVTLSRLQISAYTKRFNVLYLASQEEKESYTAEDYERAREISQKFDALNKKIRNYLASLDVAE